MELPWNLDVGDYLITDNIGAYSTASSTKFNGFDGAKIYPQELSSKQRSRQNGPPLPHRRTPSDPDHVKLFFTIAERRFTFILLRQGRELNGNGARIINARRIFTLILPRPTRKG